ncbi:MAG TPA: AAA family ATPase [Planctomycetota bacterium]|nr:AAA family ATPase [Planctomycetota bacterium]
MAYVAASSHAERLHAAAEILRTRLAARIVGLQETTELVMISLFAGGHCLLIGVPGLAKTLLVRSIADALDLDFRRIQFTPDLMPSDITGAEVIAEDVESGARDFRFRKGPIFGNVVLADEINRTSPKTQAALLEAMEERTVTIGGRRHELDDPFCVLATQNPIEQAGTYPLPAAQLDRFMFLVKLEYPTRDDEMRIVRLTTAPASEPAGALVSKAELLAIREAIAASAPPRQATAAATTLARRTRPGEKDAPETVKKYVQWGVGPRGAQHLVQGAKVRAALRGRTAPTVDDVRALVLPAFRHRLRVNFQAQADEVDEDHILNALLDGTA